MNFIRFFYNDGDNGGGGNLQDPPPVTTELSAPTPEIPVNSFTEDEIKNFGFDSKEKMIEFINKAKESSKPKEEVEKDNLIQEANFLKYAAEQNFATKEFNDYKSLQAKADRDLVFEKFATEEKADNPEATEEDIKEAFESEYKLNSENAKAKAKGEARLKKDATEIRKPSTDAWSKARSNYDEDMKLYGEKQTYEKTVDKVIGESIPAKVTVKVKDGETEIPIDIDVAKEIVDSVKEKFGGQKGFAKWIVAEGDTAGFSSSLKTKIDSYIQAEVNKAAISKAFDKGIELGKQRNPTIGADNPFPLKQGDGNGAAEAKKTSLEDSNKKMAEARERVRGNR